MTEIVLDILGGYFQFYAKWQSKKYITSHLEFWIFFFNIEGKN